MFVFQTLTHAHLTHVLTVDIVISPSLFVGMSVSVKVDGEATIVKVSFQQIF